VSADLDGEGLPSFAYSPGKRREYRAFAFPMAQSDGGLADAKDGQGVMVADLAGHDGLAIIASRCFERKSTGCADANSHPADARVRITNDRDHFRLRRSFELPGQVS